VKVIKEFIESELKKEPILVVSEYFLTTVKLDSLVNSYLVYSSYLNEDELKKSIIEDIQEMQRSDSLILELIDELRALPYEENKKTVSQERVKNIIQSHKYDSIISNAFIKNLNFNGKSVQKARLDHKLRMESQNLISRLRVLRDIHNICLIKAELEANCTDVLNLDFLQGPVTEACEQIQYAQYEKFDHDIIIYNKNKILIHRIDSVERYIRKLLKIRPSNSETLYFRGHADMKWKLIPSIYREQWIKKEDILFREIIIRHPNSFRDQRSTFEKLTKMQHYDLPTRLLDVTTNPLVALYFACLGSEDTVGEVHLFKVKNEEIKYYDSDTVSVISNISRRNYELILEHLPKDVEGFNESDEVKKLVHEIKEEKPYFKAEIVPKDLQKTVFVKPKLDNERIIRQSGAFILFGINEDKYKPSTLTNIYKPQKIHKFIVPDSAKKIIKKELELVGITHSSLFPELEKTSVQLKEQYI